MSLSLFVYFERRVFVVFAAVSEDCLMSQQWLDKRVTGVSRT